MRRDRVPTRLRVPAVMAAVIAVLALTGCGPTTGPESSDPGPAALDSTTAPTDAAPSTADSSTASSNAPAAPGPAATEETVAVPDALRFEATTVAGDAFDGGSVAGRPVVLWFWAPWCAVCRSQAPEVTDLAEQYGDDVAFVGVGSLSDSGAIADFADDVPGPVHLDDADGALYQRFGITEQSSFVVLDAGGDEVLRTGYSDDDELAGTVAGLAG